MHERKGQKIEGRGGVQPTVQHYSGGFELEDIARQGRMTRQTILKNMEGKSVDQTTKCKTNTVEAGWTVHIIKSREAVSL